MKIMHLAGALCALALSAPAAQARDAAYPSQPIRLIVPFAPGSTSDTSGRVIAQQLASRLGQAVTVDNMPGADGRIGIMAAKNAPADGYTLVLGSWTNLSVNPILVKDLPYDPLKDFKPISGVTRSMLGIAVPANSPYKTLADLVAAAKAQPEKLNFGNFAWGYRLATEWFASIAGVRFTPISYKSTSQMNTDLIGGQIDVAMDGVASLAPSAKAAKLRILAVTGEKRHVEFPDVPTIRESGYPDYSIYGWSALMARTEVSDAITRRLADTMKEVLDSKPIQEFAEKGGSELLKRDPEQMRAFNVKEIATLRTVADKAGLAAQ
ncbi:Bug family tripartite tricarboxylate transporter substrate binding protein [Pigmentiphaga kullae]|uniref:Tripartite-type tricarboxylate transporter receptor subunit TctC n=1 Tax=Pigmentiphaga kullae TaxID=151784 RepID=A0A4V2F3R0_9BURK|nr:tripartite tricarboxylate transporter substrate binding protein [Pigmentiphaga kullae]RZS84977.1 tripartite-type tricarboxylate transporter receptor subunit TctC [Pigmentiphaga kullae]